MRAIALSDAAWIEEQVAGITDARIVTSVSEWAERKRYLPASVTPMPGFYSFDVGPYLREIADCLNVDSYVQTIDVMKGVQIGATVGILENGIGYYIDHIKTAPMMLLTADGELADLRVESYILPMLQHSDLSHLIQSSDVNNKRKTGQTKKRIEWSGGGFLVPFGARNANKLRSISIRVLLEDEIDGYPEFVGKDGDPQGLAEDRQKAYSETRKTLRISTPLLAGTSRIHRGFMRGDQRRYFVPCKDCGEMQHLVFQGGRKRADDKPYGLTWALNDNGLLIPDSVRYQCKHCDSQWTNDDKAFFLPRGEWRPTVETDDPTHRSYHIPALLSPVGMFTWAGVVQEWLDAWDVENDTVKDVRELQKFYNNVLGEPFEVIGQKVRFESVSAHRRPEYRYGEVPNKFAQQHMGGRVQFLTAAVDVQQKYLSLAVFGWCVDQKCVLIDYEEFHQTDDDDSPTEITSTCWAKLREVIDERTYTAADGYSYRIALTLIDAGYANATVETFCRDYEYGVMPILGRDRPSKNQRISEFAPFETQGGVKGYRVIVDHYKDRLAPILRRTWYAEAGPQKLYHFNAPQDATDKQLKELTVESRRKKVDDKGQTVYYWYRPSNARNELWDLLVYNHAACEIVAYDLCRERFDLTVIDWPGFWEYIDQHEEYLTAPAA